MLAGPAAAAGGGATQDEGGFAVRAAGQQQSEVVDGTTEEWIWDEDEVRNLTQSLSLIIVISMQRFNVVCSMGT